MVRAAVLAVAALAALPAPASAARGQRHRPPELQRAFTARAQRALDLGLQAYVLGSPLLVERGVITNFPPNQLINVTRLSTPAQRLVVLPNVDTLYTVARLRLAGGPLVLHVPPTGGRYFTMQLLDAYTNSFAYVGRRTTGSGATDVAIAGPGWRGSVPRGVRLVRSPTPVVWLLGRTLVDGPADLPAVNALQQGYALRPLSALGGPPLASLSIPSSTLHPPTLPYRAGLLRRARRPRWPRTRPRAATARCWRGCAASGSGPGCGPRAGTSAPPPARACAPPSPRGPALGATPTRARQQRASARTHRGWLLPPKAIGNAGGDLLLRALVARTALGANVRAEAIYPQANTDGRGRPLDGAHRYVLRFAPGQLPPVRAFWSLTMYGADRFLVDNPIARYARRQPLPGAAARRRRRPDDPPPARPAPVRPAGQLAPGAGRAVPRCRCGSTSRSGRCWRTAGRCR